MKKKAKKSTQGPRPLTEMQLLRDLDSLLLVRGAVHALPSVLVNVVDVVAVSRLERRQHGHHHGPVPLHRVVVHVRVGRSRPPGSAAGLAGSRLGKFRLERLVHWKERWVREGLSVFVQGAFRISLYMMREF